jgi:uncharacterized protein YdhG (YjbR/CyaY superfamily)
MNTFGEYLDKIEDIEKKEKLKSILDKIEKDFPQLKKEIKWNQPMFTNHNTFIIAFSISKNHIAIAPESKALDKFREKINDVGYIATKEIFRIKWNQEVNYSLINEIIKYNINDKKDSQKFWR